MKRLRGALLLLTHLCFAHYSTFGQEATPGGGEPVLLEEEAPAALFEGGIGDAGVDFFLTGSWTATLSGSLGWLLTPGGGAVFPSGFPGFETSQLFRQVPNLTLSVWLAERYFLETSVIGDFFAEGYDYFDENYLLVGYRGPERAFLRQVLLGTRDIGIGSYPFLDVPASGSSSIGASALMAGAYSSHELLLRYDNNEPVSYTFLGDNLLSEEVLQLDDYVRGRFFVLPDAGVTDLEVYIQDPAGAYAGIDSLSYRLATLDDAVLDADAGTVSLRQPAEGSVLVFYRKGGSPVGSAGLGVDALPAEGTGADANKIDLAGAALDFEWNSAALDDYFGQDIDERQVTVNGRQALRLWRPGEFSPFEILAAYPVEQAVPEDLYRVRVSVTPKGSTTPVALPLRFRLTPGADHVTVYESSDLRAIGNLYPFLDDTGSGFFDPENLLYGPLADPSPGYLEHELRVGYLTPVAEYRLGADVVPGSVQVFRNGIQETRFEVDYSTGVVEFLVEVGPDDRLEITFRRRLSLANNGDLLFAWGNRFALGDSHTLELATGLRWNFLPGSYTTEAYSRTGGVLVSAALKGSLGPAAYELSVAGAYANPDTSGIMRLLGMERSGVEVGLSESTAVPAAPPADEDDPAGLGLAPGSLDADNRGKLYYEGYPYESGSKPGPYTVSDSTDDPTPGEDLVLDFELEAGQWVGAQIPLSGGGPPADLSAAEEIVISYRAMDVTAGEFDLYLQIGALGEDLDGDGRLDQELSEAAAGFAFNDTSQGAVLRVGTDADNQPNGRLDSEDVDGSGFLDAEDPPEALSILTVPVETSITADGVWSVARVALDSAQKRRLSRVRSLRLIALESAGASAGATLLIDRITLAGTRFWASPSDGTVGVREIEEWAAQGTPPQTLDEAFPEVGELFHPLGERQKVLEVEWPDATDWTVRGFTEAASEGIDYRSIVYYYRLPSVDGSDDLGFALHDDEGGSIEWTLPAASTVDAWQEVRIDRDEGRVYRNGSVLPGASVVQDTASGSLTRLTVGRAGAVASSGLLYLDELHLTDPRAGLGAAVSLKVDLQLPGTLWEAGGHPILHDLRFREEAEITTAGFAGLYGTPAESFSLVSRSELEAGISLADVAVTLDVAAQQENAGLEASIGGSHRVAVPNVPFPLRVTDSYSYRQRDSGPALLRESSVLLDFAPLLQGRFYHTAGNVDDTLTQSWEALLGVTPGSFSFENSLAIDVARSGFAVPREGYFRNWVWGYSLLWPTEEWTPLERREVLALDWQLLPQPVGLRMVGSLDAHSYELGSSARTQASRFAIELSVPVQLAGTEAAPNLQLTLEPGYRRSLELLKAEALFGNVPEDLAGAFSAFGGQRYAFTGIPFWELYDPALESRFLADSLALEGASYLAEPFVSLSRTFSSRLLDLLLPSYLEVAAGKSLEKEGDLTRLGNRYYLQSRWRAVNLFGRFGAYPLFQAYRTDEYGTDLVLSLRTGEGEVHIDELRVEHALGFENGEAGAISLENRFRLTLEEIVEWSDSLFLAFDWFRYPSGGVALPLLPAEVGVEAFWSHRESLTMELGGLLSDATSWHPFNLILRHQTTLNLPDKGQLAAGGGLGLDLERTTAGELYWRLGIEGSIDVEIRF